MHPPHPPQRVASSPRRAACVLAVALGLGLATERPAQALTLVLNFVAAPTTDIHGVGTVPETFASWGFTGMSLADIRTAALDAVVQDYLAYPSFGTAAASPLPPGFELNISFEWASGAAGPANGDAEWYQMAIGDAQPDQGFLGLACVGCVRDASGRATVPNGSIVGSVLGDSFAGLLGLAGSNAQRINLLAGTVSHEIGHALTLLHPGGPLANPGASAYSLMATGAAPSQMPASERLLDRAFAYTEFATLMQTVGLRQVSVVPEPGAAGMLLLGLAALGLRARSRGRAGA